MSSARFARSLSVGAAALLTLSSCSSAEPQPFRPDSETEMVGIALVHQDGLHQTLAQIYRQLLWSYDREAVVLDLPDQPAFSALEGYGPHILLGCSGDHLEHYYPQAAEALIDDAAKDNDQPPSDEQTAAAVEAVLPWYLATTNPARGDACPRTTWEEIPQLLMPVFTKTAFSREERLAIRHINTSLNPEVYAHINQRLSEGAEPETIAQEFLSEQHDITYVEETR